MKVTLAYQCDLEDIPTTIFELLGNLKEHSLPQVGIELQDAILSINENNITETLTSLDNVRLLLAKMDQRILDYSAILGGFVKADTNLKLGIEDEMLEMPPVNPPGTQEVSPQDILNVEEGQEVND